jgi:hypothetical protein
MKIVFLEEIVLFWHITRRRVVIVYRRCPETSVNNNYTTPRNIPEERRCRQHLGGSLKSSVPRDLNNELRSEL